MNFLKIFFIISIALSNLIMFALSHKLAESYANFNIDSSKHHQIDEHHNHHHKGEHHHIDHHAPANYKFKYGVNDPHTKDNKDAWETREGGTVKGSYSLVEADGSTRIVEYTADKHNGFNAIVQKIDHKKHDVEVWGYGNGAH